jgi:biotin operon repressor
VLKIEVLRHLTRKQGTNAPSAKTVAAALAVTEAAVTDAVQLLNSEGVYSISTKQGGGLVASTSIKKEKDTYPLIGPKVDEWVRTNIFGHYGVTDQRTNATHNKRLGGKWSNPDFTVISVNKFLHVPKNTVELVTFEVKHASIQFDVTCVYEALAHTRIAAHSVLFFYDDPGNTVSDNKLGNVLEEIKIECVRVGVGLVVSEYPSDIKTWQYLIPTRKHEPDNRRVDAFVDEAFDKVDLDWLGKLL